MSSLNCSINFITPIQVSIIINDEEVFYVGRNKQTTIKDLSISRKELLLIPDLKRYEVIVKHLNEHSCTRIDGVYLMKDEVYFARNESIIKVKNIEFTVSIPFLKNKRKSYFDYIIPSKRLKSNWEITEKYLIYTHPEFELKKKLACFDLDWTLIKTKSGKVFPVDENDWELWHEKVIKKLKTLNDFSLIIFSNQKSLAVGNKNKFQEKIENIINKLRLPFKVYISTSNGLYRKPVPGMFWHLEKILANENITVDINNSFYVGDAAGRKVGNKKDHSSADLLFAENIGLKFFTPEGYFLDDGIKISINKNCYKPNEMVNVKHFDYKLDYNEPELILMVGPPGSGKTFFVDNNLVNKGYKKISRDELKSIPNCIKTAKAYLSQGEKVVIDNTNMDHASRHKFIESFKQYKIRLFKMAFTKDLVLHNNKFRQLTDESHAAIADWIITKMINEFVEPELDEGYFEIINIPFIPKFKNDFEKKLYYLYLK